MSVLDVSTDFQQMTDCWYPDTLRHGKAPLTPQEIIDIEQWINQNIFDAAIANLQGKMNVTEAIRNNVPSPPSWIGACLQPIYDKNGQDAKLASWIYGNWVCKIGIGRQEDWWCYAQSVAEDRYSRTYILHNKINPIIQRAS